jgi:hypothetical protein
MGIQIYNFFGRFVCLFVRRGGAAWRVMRGSSGSGLWAAILQWAARASGLRGKDARVYLTTVLQTEGRVSKVD